MPHPDMPPQRGEIYWVDLGAPRGSEQAGRRPVVIISGNRANRSMRVVTVAAITTKIKQWAPDVTVLLPAGRPLKRVSQIMTFQVFTLDKRKLEGYAGGLDNQQVEDLERALRAAWEL